MRHYCEGIILELDLDNDPRYAHLNKDVAYVDVNKLAPDGKVDGAKAAELLKGPALMVVELGKNNREVPVTENIPDKARQRINQIFNVCDRLNCIPPRVPWPNHYEPCRVPDRH